MTPSAPQRRPKPATEGRARNMRAIKRSDTKPEIELRRSLHAMGLRFRKDMRVDLPGGRVRPDVVFTRQRLAVFVDFCFWHLCPQHGRLPKTNQWYWEPKLFRNVARDRANDDLLTDSGWSVIRVWEHEGIGAAAERIHEAIRIANAD